MNASNDPAGHSGDCVTSTETNWRERAEKAEADLARVQAQAAAMRDALLILKGYEFDLHIADGEKPSSLIDRALATDAGRNFIPRSELEASQKREAAMQEAIERLTKLPNVEYRCGDWKDVFAAVLHLKAFSFENSAPSFIAVEKVKPIVEALAKTRDAIELNLVGPCTGKRIDQALALARQLGIAEEGK